MVIETVRSSIPQTVLDEVELLKSPEHPNIVDLIQLVQTPPETHIVMEYCQRGDLRDILIERMIKSSHRA